MYERGDWCVGDSVREERKPGACGAEDPSFPGRRCERPEGHSGMHEKLEAGTRVGWFRPDS